MKTCKICGCDISNLPTQRKICLSEECAAQSKRNSYNNKMINKICKNCGKEFEGTYKKVICNECKEKRYKDLIDVEEYIHCKCCDNIYKVKKEKYRMIIHSLLFLIKVKDIVIIAE